MMKLNLLILLSFVLLFSSCGGDDDTNVNDDGSTDSTNAFKYDGTNYPVSIFLIEKYSIQTSFVYYYNATFNTTTLLPEGISPIVKSLDLTFNYDNNALEVPVGTYTYNNNYADWTFWGIITLYSNFSQNQFSQDIVNGGTVVVSKNNGIYTVVLNLTTRNNKTITGTITKAINHTYNR